LTYFVQRDSAMLKQLFQLLVSSSSSNTQSSAAATAAAHQLLQSTVKELLHARDLLGVEPSATLSTPIKSWVEGVMTGIDRVKRIELRRIQASKRQKNRAAVPNFGIKWLQIGSFVLAKLTRISGPYLSMADAMLQVHAHQHNTNILIEYCFHLTSLFLFLTRKGGCLQLT